MIYESNYKKMNSLGLLKLNKIGQNTEIENEPYMPLSLEVINKTEDYYELSMTHYGEQNGDLMRDPEMIIKVYPKLEAVEATYFRNDYIGSEKFVYPEGNKVDLTLKKELNSFLRIWLMNLKRQGFTL